MPGSKPPDRIVIVGGGCAGMTAAWYLSGIKRDGGERAYEVHVYEESWRLGGKGASGRDKWGRILEHGLHVWAGFYENAFAMMRDCYAEVAANGWGPDKPLGWRLPFGSIEDAFTPMPLIGLAVPHGAGGDKPGQGPDWGLWTAILPIAEGLPGTPLDPASNPFTLSNYLLRCVELVRAMMHSVTLAMDSAGTGGPGKPDFAALAADPEFAGEASLSEAGDWAAGLLRAGGVTLAGILSRAAALLEMLLRRIAAIPERPNSLLVLPIAVLAQSRKLLAELGDIDADIRRRLDVIEIVVAIAIGVYADRLLLSRSGLDAINDEDYREWLRRHGASEPALRSPFIKGIYDFAFAYRDGDRGKPEIAAGVALRGALRMFFTYRGALFWRMAAGMGETVFSPLYKVLKERGVHFHFLQRLDRIELEEWNGTLRIARLHFEAKGDRNALDAASSDALDHFGCWPDKPVRFDGSAGLTPFEIAADTDFEAVILAAGKVDACEIAERSGFFTEVAIGEKWKGANDNIATIATEAGQVWLDLNLEEYGWLRGPLIGTAFPSGFPTWADMSHSLTSEGEWRATSDPRIADPSHRAVLYLCGEMPERLVRGKDPPGANDAVRARLKTVLLDGLAPGQLRFAANDAEAEALLDDAHFQANFKGSARYTLSLPGTTAYRISPLDCSIANLALAGDWTANGLDCGCIEAAVISGMLATHAIDGKEPPIHAIVGFNHP